MNKSTSVPVSEEMTMSSQTGVYPSKTYINRSDPTTESVNLSHSRYATLYGNKKDVVVIVSDKSIERCEILQINKLLREAAKA